MKLQYYLSWDDEKELFKEFQKIFITDWGRWLRDEILIPELMKIYKDLLNEGIRDTYVILFILTQHYIESGFAP